MMCENLFIYHIDQNMPSLGCETRLCSKSSSIIAMIAILERMAEWLPVDMIMAQ